VIGPNVYVEGPCRIGGGATVRDAVVLRGSTVAGGRVVDRQLVLGESVVAELPGR
jgi:NDP-sugar pyrophosphorylase family protein